MSSSIAAVPAARSIIYLGLDVHKDSITIAVLPNGAKARPGSNDCPTTCARLRSGEKELQKGSNQAAMAATRWLRSRWIVPATTSCGCLIVHSPAAPD